LRALGEKLERFLPFILTGGGIRRSLLRGIENIEKRYIIHIAGFNLGILLLYYLVLARLGAWPMLPQGCFLPGLAL
jgi:hypothetical protein